MNLNNYFREIDILKIYEENLIKTTEINLKFNSNVDNKLKKIIFRLFFFFFLKIKANFITPHGQEVNGHN